MPVENRRAIELWHADVRAFAPFAARCESLLDARERARMLGFRLEADRARYRVSHALLRVVLSRATGGAIETIAYRSSPQGKPALATTAGTPNVTFSLSHSGDHVLIAVARDRAVGVDIQWARPGFPIVDVAARVFSIADRAVLEARTGADRVAAFYVGWTRREAYLKAIGTGFFGDASAIDTLVTAIDARILVGRFRIADLAVAPATFAALAAEGDDWSVSSIEATPRDLSAARAYRLPAPEARRGVLDPVS